jgi:hypothetical protein
MGKPVEYEFILKDGTKRYEIVCKRTDVWAFKKMHQAVSARPLRK